MTRDHPCFIQGPAGLLEALTTTPLTHARQATAVICHPHPLHQGSMHNKVVHTLSRAFDHQGISTIRFNYRGVGKSAGTFGDYEGEVEDCRAVIEWLQTSHPDHDLYLAGFSFGAYIAASNASRFPTKWLLSVAPAVHHRDYSTIEKNVRAPWLIIQGTADEIVPSEMVFEWQSQLIDRTTSPTTLIKFEGAGHFFHGRLIELRNTVEEQLKGILSD